MNGRDRSSKTLCERSMEMVTSIVKLSSFSIAKVSLGSSGCPQSSRNLSCIVGPGDPRQSQESSKPISYVGKPGEENEMGSAYLIHEEKNVDVMAEDYINKVHKKNGHYLPETSKDLPIIISPSPRLVK